jgi:pimeloyl-ACP methyl ester carboxylesterase
MKKIFLIILSIAFFSCKKTDVKLGDNVNETFYVTNKNTSMPVKVRGNTASKTFMMMIHGGPGGTSIVYRASKYLVEDVESKFAVVYWDQRDSGATQGGNTLIDANIETYCEDFRKVIMTLKYRYGNNISIFVNGHSWGGYLTPAFLTRGDNQTLVKGWIQSAGAQNLILLNEYAKELQIAKADTEIIANRNVAAWQQIKAACISTALPTDVYGFLKINASGTKAMGLTRGEQEEFTRNNGIISNYTNNHSPIGLITIQALDINPAIRKLFIDVADNHPVAGDLSLIKIPTLILYAKYDYICPAKLADDIENKIQSTYKRKVIFQKSDHSSIFTGGEQKVYWSEVIQFIERFK